MELILKGGGNEKRQSMNMEQYLERLPYQPGGAFPGSSYGDVRSMFNIRVPDLRYNCIPVGAARNTHRALNLHFPVHQVQALGCSGVDAEY